MRMLRWIGVTVLAVVALAGVLHADAKDDLSRAKSDYDSLRSKVDDVKDKTERFLDSSRALRSMDKEQLDKLVEQMCRLDTEPNDDEVDRLSRDLRERAIDTVRREYEKTIDAGGRIYDQIERVMNDAKALRTRARDLKSQDAVKDDAGRLADDLDKLVEVVDRLMEKLQSDRRTLDRVKEGVMNGANNPTIRARMEYGKEKHKSLQSSRSCDEREVVLSSGRPDCVKFDSEACKVIEFKPDTHSESAAREQANRYVDDVRRKFKDDDRAKKCKRDADGYPIFTAVGETYPACRS
ncbi:MAG: hypothetical protein M4D80_06070 [Myxococcota bacterium]|nr:hypothetical protein [Myxococcota bacterium]